MGPSPIVGGGHLMSTGPKMLLLCIVLAAVAAVAYHLGNAHSSTTPSALIATPPPPVARPSEPIVENRPNGDLEIKFPDGSSYFKGANGSSIIDVPEAARQGGVGAAQAELYEAGKLAVAGAPNPGGPKGRPVTPKDVSA